MCFPSWFYVGRFALVAELVLCTTSFDALRMITTCQNPTDANLNFDFQILNIEKFAIKIFNLWSKEVLSKQISKNDSFLTVSNLNCRIYVVRISSLNGENLTSKRFVKR